MRMRKKKHGAERIQACSSLMIENFELLKTEPDYAFENKERLLCLEIGCGKGNFACGMAAKNHDKNFKTRSRNTAKKVFRYEFRFYRRVGQ